jgi:energy-coupling factor transporter ATP-binding protein EcfA2
MLLKAESFELVCSRTVREHRKLAVMAPKRMAPYGGRKLDDGEVVVDCAKAATLLQHSEIPNGDDQATHELGVTRSVFRRIVGKRGAPFEIVKIENARRFAEKCGSCLKNIEWSGESEAQINNAAPPPITDYLELWVDLHSISHGPYVPLTMRKEDAPIDLSGVLELMMKTPTLQIIGPSGCGKTHLLAHLARISIDHGFIPIIIQARHFAGRIDAMLDEAISSATRLRFAELASTSATANVIPVVIIDALNECPPKFRPSLIPTLQELRIRSNARIIISGQTLTEVPSSLKGPTILLSLPDADQKGQLIDAYLKRPLPPDARFALDVISSAHDAMVWAEICDDSPRGLAAMLSMHPFARKCLGSTPDADVAYRALGQLAAEMREKFVFVSTEGGGGHDDRTNHWSVRTRRGGQRHNQRLRAPRLCKWTCGFSSRILASLFCNRKSFGHPEQHGRTLRNAKKTYQR